MLVNFQQTLGQIRAILFQNGFFLRLIILGIIFTSSVMVQGCFLFKEKIDNPKQKSMFPEIVDSVVVETFTKSSEAPLNEEDLKLFQEMLNAEITFRPGIKVFKKPPTELPNTIILNGNLRSYELQDQRHQDFFLRAMHFIVDLKVQTMTESQPVVEITRRFTYQKIYLPDEPVPVPSFDLHKAVVELVEMLVEEIFPSLGDDIYLNSALDPDTDKKYAHPYLVRGNRYATNHRFKRAIEYYRLLLFDPSFNNKEKKYRVSRRTLYRLKQDGLPADYLDQLEPMTSETATNMVSFREEMRDYLDGTSPYEGKIILVSDHDEDLVNLNLSAAHDNLAAIYLFQKKYDLSAYHWSRAYAHYPTLEIMEKWAGLQQARTLIPENLSVEEAIKLYQRIPPPRSIRRIPGEMERRVLPPGLLEDVTTAETASPASPSPTDLPPIGEEGLPGPLQPVELQPVKLPPVPEGSGGNQLDLPPIENN